MSGTEILVLAAAFLVVWGLLMAWVAERFGRNCFGWWVIGTVLGPLSIPALIGLVRGERAVPAESRPVRAPARPGRPAVLVAADTADGLLAGAAAARERLAWMDPAMTLALLADAEAAPRSRGFGAGSGQEVDLPSGPVLRRVEAELPEAAAESRILFGELAPAVIAEVHRGGHCLVIAQLSRGRGGRTALAALAMRAPCAVMVPAASTPTRRTAPVRVDRPVGDVR